MSEDLLRYRVYSHYLREKYHSKVYKLPINLPGNCPNRDGTISTGGCIFCDEQGAGFQCLPNTTSVQEQIATNKAFFQKRFHAQKFIAYFQAFTNTYLSLSDFQHYMQQAVLDPDIVGLSISTRPDCINDRYLDFLLDLQKKHSQPLSIDIELGLQTVNYHSLINVNRGHTLAEFLDAVQRIKSRGFEICVHIILNLPGDTLTDVIENAKIISAMKIDFVKIHSLYIVKNTILGDLYCQNKVSLISLETYIQWVVTFLEYLDPQIVIQRLVGKGPSDNYYFTNWGTSWWLIKEGIEERMLQLNTYQGAKYNYLNGSAVRKKFGN